MQLARGFLQAPFAGTDGLSHVPAWEPSWQCATGSLQGSDALFECRAVRTESGRNWARRSRLDRGFRADRPFLRDYVGAL